MVRHLVLLDKVHKFPGIVLAPIIIILTYYISANWFQLSLIRGESMYPAYHNMQFVMIDKRPDRYTYGEVITFQCDQLNSLLVKRIVACSGDQVMIQNGTLYVNDAVSEIFPEEYVFEYVGMAENAICLGKNQYFVIGDNLKESKDSRYEEVGVVGGDDIVGRIIPQIRTN